MSTPVMPIAAPQRRENRDDSFGVLNDVLRRWFYKPDLQAIRIVMGTLKAHYLDIGDPAWLFVVAPPGSGKTSVSIMGTSDLPDVAVLSDLTENTRVLRASRTGTPGETGPNGVKRTNVCE